MITDTKFRGAAASWKKGMATEGGDSLLDQVLKMIPKN